MSGNTLTDAPAPIDPAELVHDAPPMESMLAGRQRVLDELQTRGIDPSTVLLAGFNPNAPKETNPEHFDPKTGTFDFSFGTVESMDLPTANDDMELAAEKVLVNPLYYGLKPGNRLGVYDRSRMPSEVEVDEDLASNVGVWARSQSEIDAAKLLDLDLMAPAAKPAETNELEDTIPRSKLKEMMGDVTLDAAGVPEVADHKTSDASAESQEAKTPSPKYEDRYKPINADPAFVAMTEPHNNRLTEWREFFNKKSQEIHKDIEAARNDPNGFEHQGQLEGQLKALRESYDQAVVNERDAMETEVKSYLRERLEFYRKDTTAGYAQEGEIHEENRQLVTSQGRNVAWYVPGMKRYSTSTIHFGQLLPPARFGNWAGGSGQKANHKTGKTVSSSQHIVDLAAAMLSGNFGETHEPVEIKRDRNAEEYDMPAAIRSKLPIYRANLGLHRLAAERLLLGLDAAVGAVDVREE